MASKSFVHLHVHTEFSPLDGMSKVDELFDAAHGHGMPGVAITDHQNMTGMIQAARAAERTGVNFIPGNEAYHVADAKNATRRGEGKGVFHLTLLAKDFQGYQNLMKLNSWGWENEHIFDDKPMYDNEMISQLSSGLIATSGCLGSMVSQALLREDIATAEKLVGEQVDIFGKDNYFIEIMSHGMEDDAKILPMQLKLAKRMGLRLVATNDSHYTHAEDAQAHELILAIQSGSQLSDPTYDEGGRRFAFNGSGYHLRSPEEMWELFPERDFPGACANTLLVNEMVDVQIPHLGQPFHLPHYPLEGTGAETEEELLRIRTYEGLKRNHADEDGNITKAAIERAEMELEIINDMGFPGYFLVVGDCLSHVKKRGLPVGGGRGSGAGSIVNQSLNITSIDPIKYNLPFSRFLNKGRVDSPPDIDSDLTNEGQQVLFEYAVHKFGEDRVARIGNYSRMGGKSAIKDAARALGFPASFAMQLNRDFFTAQNSKMTLRDVLLGNRKDISNDDKRFWDGAESMRDFYKNDRDARRIYDMAISIEGTFRQYGVHAGGLVVSPDPIWNYTPLRRKKGDVVPFAQFDKTEVEMAGLVKIDFLGLENLNHVASAVKIINRDLGENLDINNIPLDDKNTFRLLQAADLAGVFQLGTSAGMGELIARMKPTDFEDVSAAIALYRPGPMSANAHLDYADRKNGRQAVTTLHPDLNDLLEDTYGLIVYQEQVMAISMKFAGFDEPKADDFRSAMGKKRKDKMEKMRVDWNAGFKDNGYTQKLADDLWNLVEPFSGYAFNRSHSVAYGMLAYQTAYLKANYPAQFAAAFIENSGVDKVVSNVEWARRNGIQVFAPDVNRSNAGPATSRDSIWLGLSNVSKVPHKLISGIELERQRDGAFTSVEDFVGRVQEYGLREMPLSNLAKCGAFDSMNVSRKQVVERGHEILGAASESSRDVTGGVDLFDIMGEVETALESLDLTGEDYSERQKLELEHEVMGFFGSKHPWDLYSNEIREALSLGTIPSGGLRPGQINVGEEETPAARTGDKVAIYGILMGHKTTKTANGNLKESFTLEEASGNPIQAIMFGKSRRVSDSAIGKPVVVTGMLVDAYGGEEGEVELKVDSYESIDVDHQGGRGGLRAVGSSRRRRHEKEPEPEDKPQSRRTRPTTQKSNDAWSSGASSSSADRFRRKSGGDTLNDEFASRRRQRAQKDAEPQPNAYTFQASSPEQLNALAKELQENHPYKDGAGSVIRVIFEGETVELPIKFGNLSIMDTQDIEGSSGATLID